MKINVAATALVSLLGGSNSYVTALRPSPSSPFDHQQVSFLNGVADGQEHSIRRMLWSPNHNEAPITGIELQHIPNTCRVGYSQIPVKEGNWNGDINEGRKEHHRYVCITRKPIEGEPITDLSLQSTPDCKSTDGWESIKHGAYTGNLNYGTGDIGGGLIHVYLCLKRDSKNGKQPINNLALTKTNPENDSKREGPILMPGESYNVNGNLQQVTRSGESWLVDGSKTTGVYFELWRQPAPPTPAPTPAPNPAPNPAPVSDETKCLDATKELLVDLDTKYQETVIASVTAQDPSADGGRTIKEYFSTKKHQGVQESYRIKCKDNEDGDEGTYVKLSYEAQCKGSSGSMLKDTVNLIVSGQPRCYAKICGEEFNEELFKEYTLLPTSNRASSESSLNWKCTGKLRSGSLGGCEQETKDLNEDTDAMITAGLDVVPTVADKKFLYIFKKEEKSVTFPQVAMINTFARACKSNDDATFVQIGEANFQCGTEDFFEVQGFVACLGSVCDVTEDAPSHNAAVAAQFQAKMAREGKLVNPDAKCIITSGAWSASIGIAFGAMLVVAWHLI